MTDNISGDSGTTMVKRTKHQNFEAIEIHRRDIKGAPWNPRSIAPANRSRLKKGIKKHGIVDTFVFNKRTGQLVGGHQRLSVLDELEGTDDYTITVQQIDVDENEEMQLNMALNNASLQGHFEADLQRQCFEHLLSEGVDLEGAGYTTTDVQTLFPDIFATGQLAEQIEAEADIVNTLHQMSQVGKEYESTFRESMGLDAQNERKVTPPQYDDIEVGVEDKPLGEPAKPDEWYAPKEYFKDERKRTVDQNAEVKAEADIMLTFAFQTKAQMQSFMTAFGLPDKRYFDIHDVQAAFGVEL